MPRTDLVWRQWVVDEEAAMRVIVDALDPGGYNEQLRAYLDSRIDFVREAARLVLRRRDTDRAWGRWVAS